MNHEDRLQERLERIESGAPLEACLSELPAGEAELLKTAAMLRALPHPDRAADAVAAQRANLLRTAQKRNALRTQPFAARLTASLRWVSMRVTTQPRLVTLAMAGMAVIALFAIALALRPEPQLQGAQVAAGTKPAPTDSHHKIVE